MNRALGAATAGVLLLSPLALSACSAGQVTQTATQQRDKVGAMAQVGRMMPFELKETAEGGLAQTPTGLAVTARMEGREPEGPGGMVELPMA